MPSLVQFSDALNNLEKNKMAREGQKSPDYSQSKMAREYQKSADSSQTARNDKDAPNDVGGGVEDKVRMRIATITALADELRRRRVREDQPHSAESKIKQGIFHCNNLN